jgi:hypothetical protein
VIAAKFAKLLSCYLGMRHRSYVGMMTLSQTLFSLGHEVEGAKCCSYRPESKLLSLDSSSELPSCPSTNSKSFLTLLPRSAAIDLAVVSDRGDPEVPVTS